MTEPVVPVAAAGAPDPVPETPKKPHVLRRSAILLLVVLIVVVILAVPLLLEPWLLGKLRTTLAAQRLKLNDDAKLSLSIFGGHLSGQNVRITDAGDGHLVLSAATLRGDVAVIDTLRTFDLIIDELTADACTGDLRRRSDGTIPGVPQPDDKGGDASNVDWWHYYQKVSEYLKKRREQQRQQEEQRKQHPEQQPKPEPTTPPDAERWPKARRYEPPPAPGARGHRVLIRSLHISGGSLGLPDKTAFDVARFTIDGTNVCVMQEPSENMTVSAHLETQGAGPVDLDLTRAPGEDGALRLKAPALPIEALTDPKIAGDAIAQYGPKGTANVDLATTWSGWDLKGTLTNVVDGLSLSPRPGAGGQAQQAAQVVNALKGQQLTWPMQLGGTLFAPTITNPGLDQILKGSAATAVKNAATQKATEEATKQLDKQLEKNPQLEDAKKKATDLFKGLGK